MIGEGCILKLKWIGDFMRRQTGATSKMLLKAALHLLEGNDAYIIVPRIVILKSLQHSVLMILKELGLGAKQLGGDIEFRGHSLKFRTLDYMRSAQYRRKDGDYYFEDNSCDLL